MRYQIEQATSLHSESVLLALYEELELKYDILSSKVRGLFYIVPRDQREPVLHEGNFQSCIYFRASRALEAGLGAMADEERGHRHEPQNTGDDIAFKRALADEVRIAAEDVSDHECDRTSYAAGYDTGYLRGLLRAEEILKS
jgi:hypothetical protein